MSPARRAAALSGPCFCLAPAQVACAAGGGVLWSLLLCRSSSARLRGVRQGWAATPAPPAGAVPLDPKWMPLYSKCQMLMPLGSESRHLQPHCLGITEAYTDAPNLSWHSLQGVWG